MDEKNIEAQVLNLGTPLDPQFEPQVDTKEIVLQLKAAIKARGLTVQDVIEMCEGKPNMPSSTTIKRIFGPGGENKRFNYRLTLKPLVKELLDIKPDALDIPPSASEEQHEIATLKSVILTKEQISEAQEKEIIFLSKQLEKLDVEHERQVALFTKRIEKLDAELDKVKAENDEYRKEKKEAELAEKKAAKARKFWSRLAIIFLVFSVLYLLFFDVPNVDYGLFRF